jgi:hypothetical protein
MKTTLATALAITLLAGVPAHAQGIFDNSISAGPYSSPYTLPTPPVWTPIVPQSSWSGHTSGNTTIWDPPNGGRSIQCQYIGMYTICN